MQQAEQLIRSTHTQLASMGTGAARALGVTSMAGLRPTPTTTAAAVTAPVPIPAPLPLPRVFLSADLLGTESLLELATSAFGMPLFVCSPEQHREVSLRQCKQPRGALVSLKGGARVVTLGPSLS